MPFLLFAEWDFDKLEKTQPTTSSGKQHSVDMKIFNESKKSAQDEFEYQSEKTFGKVKDFFSGNNAYSESSTYPPEESSSQEYTSSSKSGGANLNKYNCSVTAVLYAGLNDTTEWRTDYNIQATSRKKAEEEIKKRLPGTKLLGKKINKVQNVSCRSN